MDWRNVLAYLIIQWLQAKDWGKHKTVQLAAWWPKKKILPPRKVDKTGESRKGAPIWHLVAMDELGVKEVPGSGNNPRILEYNSATRLKSTQDSVPWCASFVCWCLEQVGKPSTRSARARSFEGYGEAVKVPIKGDICVFSRGAGGHVGFFHDEDDKDIYLLGGNQGNKVSITNFPKTRLLGIRRPV